MCDCCVTRNFLTREEKIVQLKEYRDDLGTETKAVTEKIEDLEKAK